MIRWQNLFNLRLLTERSQAAAGLWMKLQQGRDRSRSIVKGHLCPKYRSPSGQYGTKFWAPCKALSFGTFTFAKPCNGDFQMVPNFGPLAKPCNGDFHWDAPAAAGSPLQLSPHSWRKFFWNRGRISWCPVRERAGYRAGKADQLISANDKPHPPTPL